MIFLNAKTMAVLGCNIYNFCQLLKDQTNEQQT